MSPQKISRTVPLSVRLTAEEREKINAQAAAAGITPSRFLRETALGIFIRSEADASVLRELRRLGGLCKHAINNNTASGDAAQAFKDLSTYATALCRTTPENR